MDHGKHIGKLVEGLPRFRDGRVDFSHAGISPILSIVPYHDGQILLLRRSSHVGRHKGLWNTVSSFIDRLDVGIEELARHGLHEETGIRDKHIKRLVVGEPYETGDAHHDHKNWIVFPVLAELHAKPKILLNWQHTDHIWITPQQLQEYPRPALLHLSINTALKHIEGQAA